MNGEKPSDKSLRKIQFPVLKSNSENFLGEPLLSYHLVVNFNIKLEEMVSRLKKHLKTIILSLMKGFRFLQLSDSICYCAKKRFFKFQYEKFLNLFEMFNKNEIIKKEKKKNSLTQKTIKSNLNLMEKKSAVLKKFINFDRKYMGLFLKRPKKINAWSYLEWTTSIKQDFFSIFLITFKKYLCFIKKVNNNNKKEIFMKKTLEKRYFQSCFFNILNKFRKSD